MSCVYEILNKIFMQKQTMSQDLKLSTIFPQDLFKKLNENYNQKSVQDEIAVMKNELLGYQKDFVKYAKDISSNNLRNPYGAMINELSEKIQKKEDELKNQTIPIKTSENCDKDTTTNQLSPVTTTTMDRESTMDPKKNSTEIQEPSCNENHSVTKIPAFGCFFFGLQSFSQIQNFFDFST